MPEAGRMPNWSTWVWLAAVCACSAIALTLILAGIQDGLRTGVAFAFLLVCPGGAVLGGLRPGLDPVPRLVLGVALSVAIDMVVAEVMAFASLWSLRAAIASLAVLSVVAAFAELARLSHSRSEAAALDGRIGSGGAVP